MYSLSFPDMLNNSNVKLLEDKEAAISNLKLTIMSLKKRLFGDPNFGADLVRFLYAQNNSILRDLIKEEIYTAITRYVPLVLVTRNSITVTAGTTDEFGNTINPSSVYVTVKYQYIKDTTLDVLTIDLVSE